MADQFGNRVKGKAMLSDVTNCYIENSRNLLAVIGVKNLAIINTKNGILVIDKNSSEKVKELHKKIINQISNIKNFNWGKITDMGENIGARMYRVEIKSGHKICTLDHFKNPANWMVISGEAKMSSKSIDTNLFLNESKYLDAIEELTIKNSGNNLLIMVVVELFNNSNNTNKFSYNYYGSRYNG